MMINAAYNAISGINMASKMAEQASANIANMPVNDTDVAQNIIQMDMAKNQVSANAAVIKSVDETLGSLINTYA